MNVTELSRAVRNGESPYVGVDVAVRQDKGLHFAFRVSTGVWSVQLPFRAMVRLKLEWPYIDLQPLKGTQIPLSQQLRQVFVVSDRDSEAIAAGLLHAEIVAIDAPRNLPRGPDRRDSETIWHNTIIPGVKGKPGGIFWTPLKDEMEEAIRAYFADQKDCRCTTTQLRLLADALWMLIGFWLYESVATLGCPAIEFYPNASQAVFREIAGDEKSRTRLEQEIAVWWDGVCLDTVYNKKTDKADGQLGSLIAFLHRRGLTQELARDEIVIPKRRQTSVWDSPNNVVTEGGMP